MRLRVEGRRNYRHSENLDEDSVVEGTEEEEQLIAPLLLPNAEPLLSEMIAHRDTDIRRSSGVSLSAASRSGEGMCIALKQRLRMIRVLFFERENIFYNNSVFWFFWNSPAQFSLSLAFA